MGQKDQPVHNNTCREHRESMRDDQHLKGVIGGNYICEDMISPSSLLRSDRFSRSKAIVLVVGQGEEKTKLSDQARNREDKTISSASGGLCREFNPLMIGGVNTMHGIVSDVTKRGKAPSKVRPTTTGGTTSQVRSTLGHLKGSEPDGGNHFPPFEVTPSSQKMSVVGCFSKIQSLDTDSDSQPSNKVHRRGQICSSLSVGPDLTKLSSHRAQLSQSPLTSASRDFTSLPEDNFQLSPMRSKPAVVRVSPDEIPRKVSQRLGPSSHLDDEWSSRCFKFTQQIIEYGQSWSQSSSSDGQISTSPIMSR